MKWREMSLKTTVATVKNFQKKLLGSEDLEYFRESKELTESQKLKNTFE